MIERAPREFIQGRKGTLRATELQKSFSNLKISSLPLAKFLLCQRSAFRFAMNILRRPKSSEIYVEIANGKRTDLSEKLVSRSIQYRNSAGQSRLEEGKDTPVLMADTPFPSSESSKAVEIQSMQALALDRVESSIGESLDEVILHPGNSPRPIVGLGGSAGSLGALRSFFSKMAPDSGLAFVVVVHLSPDHESSMALLLQGFTSMSVVQVFDTVKVEPNCVYVIPPVNIFRCPTENCAFRSCYLGEVGESLSTSSFALWLIPTGHRLLLSYYPARMATEQSD
jgi:CheB methylesterase